MRRLKCRTPHPVSTPPGHAGWVTCEEAPPPRLLPLHRPLRPTRRPPPPRPPFPPHRRGARSRTLPHGRSLGYTRRGSPSLTPSSPPSPPPDPSSYPSPPTLPFLPAWSTFANFPPRSSVHSPSSTLTSSAGSIPYPLLPRLDQPPHREDGDGPAALTILSELPSSPVFPFDHLSGPPRSSAHSPSSAPTSSAGPIPYPLLPRLDQPPHREDGDSPTALTILSELPSSPVFPFDHLSGPPRLSAHSPSSAPTSSAGPIPYPLLPRLDQPPRREDGDGPAALTVLSELPSSPVFPFDHLPGI